MLRDADGSISGQPGGGDQEWLRQRKIRKRNLAWVRSLELVPDSAPVSAGYSKSCVCTLPPRFVSRVTFDRPYVGMSVNAVSPTSSALFDVNRVAERLCVSPSFVRRMIYERRTPFCKLGKFVRFDPAEIDAWIDARRVQAAS